MKNSRLLSSFNLDFFNFQMRAILKQLELETQEKNPDVFQ